MLLCALERSTLCTGFICCLSPSPQQAQAAAQQHVLKNERSADVCCSEIETKTRQKLTGEVYLNDILDESEAEAATEVEFPEATNLPGLSVPSNPLAEQAA